ncbi:MAG TPA: hypothetical protein P5279_12790 [Anaerohalosphaeraceae bacterium]|jgi:hypothetical protein|nr:hypothetical protein [Anaerohalosphaeraceae bacterium]HRT51367.1 hypothetical protein [Anaerohalosphaeraceae bacterium]HRT87318.1 hypothetical protein [Anaerohalosphaeraceae bacterium]
MAIIEVNWRPGRKDLRVFGTAALIATALLAVVLHYRKGLPVVWMGCIAGFGLAVFVVSFVLPCVARIVYVVMMVLALPIGLALSLLMMAVIYYLILTPVGLFFRLVGRDLLGLKFDRRASSYWVKRRPPENLKRYFNQF